MEIYEYIMPDAILLILLIEKYKSITTLREQTFQCCSKFTNINIMQATITSIRGEVFENWSEPDNALFIPHYVYCNCP